MKAVAWADALDLKNAGAALFEPDLDHLNLEAILVLASSAPKSSNRSWLPLPPGSGISASGHWG
jgi:hypothetical protein